MFIISEKLRVEAVEVPVIGVLCKYNQLKPVSRPFEGVIRCLYNTQVVVIILKLIFSVLPDLL